MAAQSVGSPGSLRLDMTDESLRKQGPMMRQILSGVKKLRKWKLKFFIVEDNCLYSRAHEEAPVVKVAHLPSYTLKDLEKNKGRCLQLSRTGDKSAGDERIVVLPLSPEEREMWCIWLVEAGASPEDGSEAASFAGFTPVGRASIEPLLQRFPRASAAPEGGLLYNSAEVSEMRGHIMGFVKKIGADVLQGQDLTKIALPLEIFEPSSFLERLALDFTSAPTYLTKAAKCTNPVQRLEAVIAFIVAGMHRSPASPKKPVNPEVGETYQATLADGTRIFCEQLEKHPPVSAWLVLGDGYRFHGRGEFKANVRGNHIRTSFVGPHTIEFVDGTSVTWSVPDLWFCNIVWGARRAEWIGVAEVSMTPHRLGATLSFGQSPSGVARAISLVRRTTKVPSDFFTGRIFSLDKPDSAVRTIEGSWLSALEFDGRRAWDITDTSVDSVVTSAARPLPSDCTLRDDVIAMRSGNYALAESLRTRRREDRKEAKRKAKR